MSPMLGCPGFVDCLGRPESCLAAENLTTRRLPTRLRHHDYRALRQPPLPLSPSSGSGHGPNFRLTYKEKGRTVTESFASPAARRKTQREIEEYRRWQELSREFVEVNARLCRLRSAEEPALTPEKKNCGNPPAGNQPGNRAFTAADFLRTPKDREAGFRSGGEGSSFQHASSRCSRFEPTARV